MGTIVAKEGFQSPEDQRDFWLFLLVTFLCGLTWSAQTLLAPILNQTLPVTSTGTVLGAAAVPMVFAAVSVASLIRRFGAKHTATLSLFIIFVGHMSFTVTDTMLLPAALSRVVSALGFGFFVPSTMLFAKRCLGTSKSTYLFGVYSSMILVSFAFGPAIFGSYLYRHGKYFFLISSVPILLALVLAVLVPSRVGTLLADPPVSSPESPLDLGPRAWPAFIMIFLINLIAGFTNSFLSAYMMQSGVPVGYFFGPQSAALIFSRLTVMRVIEELSVWGKIMAAFLFVSASYLVVLARADWWSFAISGLICGTGISIAYPTLSMWLSGQYTRSQEFTRVKAISLFNAAYFLGGNVTAFLGGFVISRFGERELVFSLVLIGVASTMLVLILRQRFSRQSVDAGQT